MMAPRNRLLFWVGALVPVLTVGATLPGTWHLAVFLCLALVSVAILDAALAVGRLNDVRVTLPDLVRLTKDREGEIGLRIEYPPNSLSLIRLGLALPMDIRSPRKEMTVGLPPGEEAAGVSWQVASSRRGRFFIEKVYVETASKMGFWAVRRAVPVRSEIRVYPNIFSESQQLAALFLGRGVLGSHALRQIGKGREFEKLREYLPSDSFEDIHWKATAKRGRPITKIFQIERTQEIYVIIDASRLSARRPLNGGDDLPGETILERFVTAGLVLGLAAGRQGDLFGLVAFSNKVQRFVRAKNGKTHYDACREALYTIEPQGVSPDYAEVFTFIATRLRRRALLLFLTNMDDPVLAEHFSSHISILARKHLVLVSMIRPPRAEPLFIRPDRVTGTDDIYTSLGGHFLWKNLDETQKVLSQWGVDFSLLENEKLCAQLVTQYMNIKKRQAL